MSNELTDGRVAAQPGNVADKAPLLATALLHLAALTLMLATETGIVAKLMFLLTWGILNFAWMAVLRRPAAAAALSLALLCILALLSRLKFDVVYMTVDFLDVIIVDVETIAFLLTIYPDLKWISVGVACAFAVVLVVLWRIDRPRMRRRAAALACAACLAGQIVLSFVAPGNWWEVFSNDNYVSKFSRSSVAAVSELATHGLFESDAIAAGQLAATDDTACRPAVKPPHIILIHDESSYDIRVAPGVKVPEGYGSHFGSFDGKHRRLMVESFGGASWYSEFNVLTGLSSQSFGRFAYFLPRVAAGRIERGLPRVLQRCGYRTYSFYPVSSAFMNAKGFHASTGIEQVFDNRAMGSDKIEPDGFYYTAALDKIRQDERKGPIFAYVYLAANHFPFTRRWNPDLLPGWKDPGNVKPEVDEYLRRQAVSVRDYAAFLDRLRREYPGEPFLILRYGDHQPAFPPPNLMEPDISENEVAQKIRARDPKYFATYYAIDTINFRPVETASALDTLDAPYLPLVMLEFAGLPLDPSFVEQKKIFARCSGIFYACAAGAETRRFNRLLIDAGLIKRL